MVLDIVNSRKRRVGMMDTQKARSERSVLSVCPPQRSPARQAQGAKFGGCRRWHTTFVIQREKLYLQFFLLY